MSFGIGANCDGEGSVSSMWIEDKRLLGRALDARSMWKDLASHQALHIAPDEVLILSQKESVQSPTDGLLHLMANKRTTMLDLFLYLKDVNLLSAMEIIKKYVPSVYHHYIQPDNVIGTAMEDIPTNPIDLEPAAPPLLIDNNSHPDPQRLMLPQDMLHSGLTSDDNLLSSMEELTSTQKRAAHTIISTRNFDIEELKEATEDFHEKYLLSKGQFSSIYNVNIKNTKFAAKIYNLDYDAVLSDLQDTRQHNHENIVPITGKCLNGDHVIVLYELMANGSLRGLLDNRGVLNMNQRLSILRDAARGLQYLHSNKPPLLHRNVKSKNILLDSAYKAKLADFGMAVHANKSDSGTASQCYTHFSTKQDNSVVQRSKGYCAKEVVNGRFSEKSDTYAFGVVILEVCTGLLAHDPSRRIADQELVNYIENNVMDIEDAWDLADSSTRWARQTYVALFKLAQQCVAERAKCRPTMNIVYTKLDEITNENCGAVYQCDNQALHPSRTEVEELAANETPSYAQHPHMMYSQLARQDMAADVQQHAMMSHPAMTEHVHHHHMMNSLPAIHTTYPSTNIVHSQPPMTSPGSYHGYPMPLTADQPPTNPSAHTLQAPHHLVESQLSETNSSISELDFSSISAGQLSIQDPGDSQELRSQEVFDREVRNIDNEYRENATPIGSADFVDTDLTPKGVEHRLFDYLEEAEKQLDYSSDESEEEEEDELNPDLLAELEKLNLVSG